MAKVVGTTSSEDFLAESGPTFLYSNNVSWLNVTFQYDSVSFIARHHSQIAERDTDIVRLFHCPSDRPSVARWYCAKVTEPIVS